MLMSPVLAPTLAKPTKRTEIPVTSWISPMPRTIFFITFDQSEHDSGVKPSLLGILLVRTAKIQPSMGFAFISPERPTTPRTIPIEERQSVKAAGMMNETIT